MPKPTLIALPYSPWSEKARWALDHHGIGYDEETYVPMVGEPWLRVRTRTFSGRVSVPVLITPHGVIFDSLRIARHADRIGKGPSLFPRELEAAIDAWNETSEQMLAAARGLVIERLQRSPGALEEALPSFVPRVARPALRPLARFGAAFVARKYEARDDAERIDAALGSLRAAIEGGREYLFDRFPYADIAMAVALQSIKAPGGHLKIGPATRETWTDPMRASRDADLLTWRDAIYRKHRSGSAALVA
jgi:glutathione S-transferase